ncbi:MAG: peptide-methionine (S)-S-oxide reductase MsrA, partial [Planctomycetia bacterium]
GCVPGSAAGTVPGAAAAPAPAKELPAEALATFGGGCFWCTEAVYLRLAGVLGVMPGYAGGEVAHPTYQQVCEGTTGHAEVVQVRYDPRRIEYATLLKVFFKTHDPTTLNRQGYDEGTQYRSIVLFHDAEQERVARAAIARLEAEKAWPDPIVTQVVAYTTFYAAEDYHRDYFARNPTQGYCRAVVAPKVEKFEHAFAELLKR